MSHVEHEVKEPEASDQAQILLAFEQAKSLGLQPEELEVSMIDHHNWVGKVGCDGCIALFIKVKAGEVVETRQW
jgi:hypothetical protein